MIKRIFRKEFFITLFIKQNKHHRFGVLLHTLAVISNSIKLKQYKIIPAALLHDIGKPIIAFQEEKDIINKEYSFHNHEEISYQFDSKRLGHKKMRELVLGLFDQYAEK